ncbi:MAG: hypothetical protein J6W74_05430 [Bacteroidales bacterium]|nr:hypothetical protein [Bacteroidales bacterium]
MRLREYRDSRTRQGIFLFTTDHLESGVLFRNDEDFTYAVNSIALMTLVNEVKVLCYCVMGNHVHVLVKGRFDHCETYFTRVLERISKYISSKYGLKGLLPKVCIDLQIITDDKRLRNEVLYVLRNPYKARICSPISYPWSSWEVYFNPYLSYLHGEKISGAKYSRLGFRTHIEIPEEWEHLGGRVMNKCFVDAVTVERCFEDSLRYFDGLRIYDLESTVRLAHGLDETIVFTDQELQEKIKVICEQEYHVVSFHQLDRKALVMLARSLSKRYSATKKQISRLLGVRLDDLDRIL